MLYSAVTATQRLRRPQQWPARRATELEVCGKQYTVWVQRYPGFARHGWRTRLGSTYRKRTTEGLRRCELSEPFACLSLRSRPGRPPPRRCKYAHYGSAFRANIATEIRPGRFPRRNGHAALTAIAGAGPVSARRALMLCYDALAQPLFAPLRLAALLMKPQLAPVAHGSRGFFT